VGFTRTKDRAFNTYNSFAGWLARRPRPLRLGVYSALGLVMWGAYLLPGNRVRPTIVALSEKVGAPSPARFYGRYLRRFISGLDLAERVRHGFAAEVDGLLTIEDKDRFDAILAKGGMFLALPHLHASVAMSRALSRSYRVLLVIRLTTDPKRAEAQRLLFDQVGCDILDARNEPAGAIARKTLRALRDGKIVIGTVDRIRPPPEGDIDIARGQVRARVLGQDVGVESWPTRFAREAKVPVVPATVRQTGDGLRLIIGKEVWPTENLVDSTQAWMDEVVTLLRANPEEWNFALDKNWSRVLIESRAR
jgi:KDO2-lipid IV(A) lauroyltransferase